MLLKTIVNTYNSGHCIHASSSSSSSSSPHHVWRYVDEGRNGFVDGMKNEGIFEQSHCPDQRAMGDSISNHKESFVGREKNDLNK
jgi:hypothetical protein